MENNGNIRQWGTADNMLQHWFVEHAGDGFYYIRNGHSNRYMEEDPGSGNVRQWAFNGDQAQQWRFVAATPAPSGSLTARYEFEGNAQDSVDANHGAATGAPACAGGVEGRAVVLDGANDYITLPAGIANHDDITLAAWVYWNGSSAWQRIFDFGNGTDSYMFLTPRSGDSTLRFAVRNGDGEEVLDTSMPAVGQWVHIAVTLGGNTGVMYINGAPRVAGQMLIDPSDFNPAVNYVGKSQWPDPLFNGRIDELRVYDYALDAPQVADLVQVGPADSPTVAYWTFEEGKADTHVPYTSGPAGLYDGSLLDVSGGGNHLSAWAAGWEWYRSAVPAPVTPQTGSANILSVQPANDWNAMSAICTSLTTWNPEQWTIEGAFRTDRITGYQTVVDHDSYGAYAGDPGCGSISRTSRSVKPGTP